MQIRIHEVAPRDGLQNEAAIVPTEAKVAFIEHLVASGCTDIEVSSFVRPRWIPQLADAAEVVARLPRAEGVTYWGLVPNQRGLDRAIDCGMEAVATFMSASETHNNRNLNRTRRESLVGLRQVIRSAVSSGLRVRGYISTVFGCPFEGPVAPEASLNLAEELLDAGAECIALGDTTGMGNPTQVAELVGLFQDGGIPLERLALHMHDTRGTALANVLAGFQAGIRHFDASVAGLGGCPYAPGASGNLASEDLVYMLREMGHDTGIDLDALSAAGHFIEGSLGRELPGRYHLYDKGSLSTARAEESA